MDTIISAEDTPRTKPHPDPVLAALHRLGVTPERAVMIGDTTSDIQAGRAAGTKTIGALYGFHADQLLSSHPDFTVHNITEIQPILLAA